MRLRSASGPRTFGARGFRGWQLQLLHCQLRAFRPFRKPKERPPARCRTPESCRPMPDRAAFAFRRSSSQLAPSYFLLRPYDLFLDIPDLLLSAHYSRLEVDKTGVDGIQFSVGRHLSRHRKPYGGDRKDRENREQVSLLPQPFDLP